LVGKAKLSDNPDSSKVVEDRPFGKAFSFGKLQVDKNGL
jgi:hypothetical protein